VTDEIADQLAYLREQNRSSGFDIWLRVSSAGASFMLLEASTRELKFISPPVEVTGAHEFRCALDAAIGAARR
jgi:hypothetical protein